MDDPPKSPDLNPIELLWDKRSTNVDRLVTSITRPTTSDFVAWMTEEYHKLEYKIWFNP